MMIMILTLNDISVAFHYMHAANFTAIEPVLAWDKSFIHILFTGTYAGGPGSFVIYSDDAGSTWHHSQFVGNTSSGECQVASLGNAGSSVLIIAMRLSNYGRLLAYSKDDGETWTDLTEATTLYPETSCEGSILAIPYKGAFLDTHLYFTAPHSPFRLNMTVFTSTDGGHSWKTGHILWSGPSAYSSLAYDEVKMYCLYEKGNKGYDETLTLAVFSPLISP